MVKQARATRTREALIEAAAAAFDQAGYEGASLQRISEAAGISLGALTFHFSSKRDLARTVQRRGTATTLDAVAKLSLGSDPTLPTVIAITVEIARLMEEDPSVRAAARLAREHDAHSHWPKSWLPALEDLRARPVDTGCTPEETETVLALAAHLVAGAEVYIRNQPCEGDAERESAPTQLGQIWGLVARGTGCEGPAHRAG
ncbi:TetR family transcriptional regulator [Streptomyces sp. NPDC091272]|uniref:TetR family transcriptional regulator n=1 Tax=Streptomyces sp. NPDC091272 TaxID=3365981 RepID=UPI0037FD9E4C